MKRLVTQLETYAVPIAFLILCYFFAQHANLKVPYVLAELTARLARNLVLTLSLVIPVVAGLGLNFGIVLGAMAGQSALILVRHWHLTGIMGFTVALAIATPTAIVLGWLVGRLLNRAKGREMITGIIASFFANGVYSLFFLFAVGSGPALMRWAHAGGSGPILLIAGVVLVGAVLIVRFFLAGAQATAELVPSTAPVWLKPAAITVGGLLLATHVLGLVTVTDTELIQPQGFGLRTSVTLDWSAHPATATEPARPEGKVAGALDELGAIRPFYKSELKAPAATDTSAMDKYELDKLWGNWSIPLGTFGAVVLVCLAIWFLLGTKLGQEMRALGQDMHIAGVLGIGVDQTRVIAIVLSTVLAAWGQMVFLQNLGTINVYSSHEQVGMMAVAALLIGGASASEAKIVHALLGTLLLHLLMLLSAAAGPNLFPDNKSGGAQLGEYVRCSAAYGVIALALALHAYKEARRRASEQERS